MQLAKVCRSWELEGPLSGDLRRIADARSCGAAGWIIGQPDLPARTVGTPKQTLVKPRHYATNAIGTKRHTSLFGLSLSKCLRRQFIRGKSESLRL
jgi:hypothetical protein